MIGLIALGAAAVAASEKPDLSGQWRLDVARSAYEQSPGPRAEIETIAQSPSRIRFHIVSTTRDVTVDYALTLPTDGSLIPLAGGTRVDPSHTLHAASARWDGPVLELRERIDGDDGIREVILRYSLSRDGDTLSMQAITADHRVIRTLMFDRCAEGARCG